MAIQYCYKTENRSDEISVFMSRDGLDITVTGSFTEQTSPQASSCTDSLGPTEQSICCETAMLDTVDRFQLSPTNYTFGIMITNNDARPLAFANEYRSKQLQASLGLSVLPTGDTTSWPENSLVTDSLLLLRFLTGE